MNTEALNALIKGIVQYNMYAEQGQEAGVADQMASARQKILDELSKTYRIDEQLAESLVKQFDEDYTKYYRVIETYAG
jgi:hypothetical protein